MSDKPQLYHHPSVFKMRRGGSLRNVTIAYETWGELNAAADNAILIFTGLSPSAHATSSVQNPNAGWWEDIVGPGRPIDTNKQFVICINSLGSCFGTTGPESVNPETNERYRLDFPVLSIEDVAQCGALLLDHLKIQILHCTVGPSMGGMSALAFCFMYPARVKHLISISSACRALPFAIALRSLQREMICADRLWQQGQYALDALPATGLSLARKLGMITYRSAQEWEQRFGRERVSQPQPGDFLFSGEFEVESYLSAHAAKFVGAFDPNCYLYLSRAMDLYDAADHGGSLACSFDLLQIDSALIIGAHSDILFPPKQQLELSQLLSARKIQVTYKMLDSIQGHDSFLVDMDRFRPEIANYLNALDTA